MWQIWISGILGLWVILLAFLDFSSTLTTFFLIATGAVLTTLNFWLLSLIKIPQAQHPDSEILPSPPNIIINEGEKKDEAAPEPENNTPQNN